jgi:addiction module HigA family antidote
MKMKTPKNGMRPIHPGEILREEFLKPLDMSANALGIALGVPANRVSAIVAEERAITADTALRLARALNTSAEFWMNLQKTYELRVAETDKETVESLKHVRPVVHA